MIDDNELKCLQKKDKKNKKNKNKDKKRMRTTPGIPTWSPTVVLTGPEHD